jgi:hypothetical protein
MAKLTMKQTNQLVAIVRELTWAQTYLQSPSVAVARVEKRATTTLHFTHPYDDRILYEINKEIGSPLCGYASALSDLKRFIETHA